MNVIYFNLYVLIAGLAVLTLTIGRCYMKNNTFDMFLYPNENDKLIENKVFLIYHISVYFILGLIFKYDIFYLMLFKILVFEMYLYFIQYCDIFKTSGSLNLVITIIISLVSYIFGCFVSTIKI